MNTDAGEVMLREACADDQSAVLELFRDGRLDDRDAAADAGEDIAQMSDVYLDDPGARLWVAEIDGVVVGMIGLRDLGAHVCELRRLRVHHDFRGRGVGRRLIEHALAHCREQAFLKVVLDTFVERRPAIALFERYGFRHARERDLGARTLREFYLDLYKDPGQ